MNDDMQYRECGALLTNQGAVSFAYCEKQHSPWRATFRRQGRYFSNADALSGYAAGRGWISISQVDMLADALKILSAGILIIENGGRK